MAGKKKVWLRCGIIVVLLIVYFFRLFQVREEYREYTVSYPGLGEAFTECGLQFKVDGVREFTLDSFEKEYGEIPKEMKERMDGQRILLYETVFSVYNSTQKAISYETYSVTLQGTTWNMQPASEFNRLAGYDKMYVELEPGESAEFHNIYRISDITFETYFDKVTGERKYLVFSMDKEKKMVELPS